MTRQTYATEIAGLKLELRLFEIKPGLRIAILTEGDRASGCTSMRLGICRCLRV
jgi:hypothetical protein